MQDPRSTPVPPPASRTSTKTAAPAASPQAVLTIRPTIVAAAMSQEQAQLLTTLECLLALDWTTSRTHEVDLDLPTSGTHMRMSRQGMTEVHLDIAQTENVLVPAMESRFGPGHEITNTYRRIHRWLVNGHEVILDICRSGLSCLIVA